MIDLWQTASRGSNDGSGMTSQIQVLRTVSLSCSRSFRTELGMTTKCQLRAAARLMALAGQITADTTLVTVALIANLVALAVAVTELREPQQHSAQAAATRAAARQLHEASPQVRAPAPYGQGSAADPGADRGRPCPSRHASAAIRPSRTAWSWSDSPTATRRPVAASASRAGPLTPRGRQRSC